MKWSENMIKKLKGEREVGDVQLECHRWKGKIMKIFKKTVEVNTVVQSLGDECLQSVHPDCFPTQQKAVHINVLPDEFFKDLEL